MKIPATALLSGLLCCLLPSCCSNAGPRFWEARDGTGRARIYTMDTVQVPLHKVGRDSQAYVDGAGKVVQVAKPRLVREITEDEWMKATSGTRYALWYCGHCKGCWAKVRGR